MLWGILLQGLLFRYHYKGMLEAWIWCTKQEGCEGYEYGCQKWYSGMIMSEWWDIITRECWGSDYNARSTKIIRDISMMEDGFNAQRLLGILWWLLSGLSGYMVRSEWLGYGYDGRMLFRRLVWFTDVVRDIGMTVNGRDVVQIDECY